MPGLCVVPVMTQAIPEAPAGYSPAIPEIRLSLEQLEILNKYAPETITPAQLTGVPPRVVVVVPKDSRLEGLLAQYKPLKAARDEAAEAFDANSKAIRAELEEMYPPEKRPSEAYEIPASLMWPQLTFAYKEMKQLATKQVKQLLPVVYNAFTVTRSWWELRESTSGKPRGGRR